MRPEYLPPHDPAPAVDDSALPADPAVPGRLVTDNEQPNLSPQESLYSQRQTVQAMTKVPAEFNGETANCR